MSVDRVVIGLWTAWILSWLAAARWTAPTTRRADPISQLHYGPLIWAGAVLVFTRVLPAPLERPLITIPSPVSWLLAAVVLLGFAWAWWARLHLGRLWSGLVALKVNHVIVRSGPYKYTRHPIYSGILLALLATVIMRDNVAAIVGWCLALAGFVVKLRQEEQLLRRERGPEYDDYRRTVPALVPRPWHSA